MDKEIEDMAAAIRTNLEITGRFVGMIQKLFTREDVEALEDAIYQIHGPKMDALHPGIEQTLDSIKERIEALLPPEG